MIAVIDATRSPLPQNASRGFSKGDCTYSLIEGWSLSHVQPFMARNGLPDPSTLESLVRSVAPNRVGGGFGCQRLPAV